MEGIHYKIDDAKKKIMYMFTVSNVVLAFGLATTLDGFMHHNYYYVGIGMVFIIIGTILLMHTNKTVDEKIHNLTAGVFGQNV